MSEQAPFAIREASLSRANAAAGVQLVIFSMRAPYKVARLEPLVNAVLATSSR